MRTILHESSRDKADRGAKQTLCLSSILFCPRSPSFWGPPGSRNRVPLANRTVCGTRSPAWRPRADTVSPLPRAPAASLAQLSCTHLLLPFLLALLLSLSTAASELPPRAVLPLPGVTAGRALVSSAPGQLLGRPWRTVTASCWRTRGKWCWCVLTASAFWPGPRCAAWQCWRVPAWLWERE